MLKLIAFICFSLLCVVHGIFISNNISNFCRSVSSVLCRNLFQQFSVGPIIVWSYAGSYPVLALWLHGLSKQRFELPLYLFASRRRSHSIEQLLASQNS